MSFVDFVKFCVCPSFGIEDKMWDVIVLIPNHYPSIYVLFTNTVDPRYLDFGYLE